MLVVCVCERVQMYINITHSYSILMAVCIAQRVMCLNMV